MWREVYFIVSPHVTETLAGAHTMVFTPWSSHHAGAHGVVTTPHAGSDQMMQSTKPSGATSSPAAQGGTRRILEDAVRGVKQQTFLTRPSMGGYAESAYGLTEALSWRVCLSMGV